MNDEFDSKFYLATLRTARDCGFPVLRKEKCALLMAIVTVWGNNEGFTLSPKFKADCEYIKETFHVNGGEKPDASFSVMLKAYVSRCEAVKDEQDPFFQECAKLIKDSYGFKLLC